MREVAASVRDHREMEARRQLWGEPSRTEARRAGFAAEVATPSELVAVLQLIHRDASEDLDDAAVYAREAEEEVGRIERLAAALANRLLSTADVALIHALLDPAQRSAAAAQDRVAAAEAWAANVMSALRMARRHVELQGQGAAGAFYGS